MFKGIGWFGRRGPKLSEQALAGALVSRADQARDTRRFNEAAVLYSEAIALGFPGGGIHVQAGHMFKEAGDLAAAEQHYRAAAKLMPANADLALQFGHFYRTSGQLREAEQAYRRAAKLKPDWTVPREQLAHLRVLGWRGPAGAIDEEPVIPAEPAAEEDVEALKRAVAVARLAPEVMPLTQRQRLHRNGESIHIRRLGRSRRSYWGEHQTLSGVEAIRGFCISAEPIVEMQILLNGQVIHRGSTRVYPLKNELENFELRKYIFNVWLDFSQFTPGRYHIELRFNDVNNSRDDHGGRRSHRQHVVIAGPVPEPRFKGGDAWTPPTDPDDVRSVEEQVNARPSIVHAARRAIFDSPPRNVLVARTDQLGDVVISIPALRRLREILPDAHLVGLFTSANADLVRTLGIFDEVIVVRFPDDAEQRKRVMTPEDQEELRQRLEPYAFDLAMDLAPSGVSRPILLLSGAAFLAGFGDGAWSSILSLGFDFNSHDAVAGLDIMSASSKTLAFVESLGAMLQSKAEIVRRPELSRDALAQFGIGPNDHYVVLHTGARVVFSRWAHYNALAARILAETGCKIIMLSEDPATRAGLTPDLAADARFRLVDQRLSFDDFDALLSYCALFVGNDSGPKHLASLRGANVVSLHTARINWGEWGQELTGSIISRQVPCAGCQIYHDPEECGKDFACVALISVDEVFAAMRPFLAEVGVAADAAA